jgi:hypothetical protein
MSSSFMPWWAYVIIMVVGLALTILFAILWTSARRRPQWPGGPSGTGGTGLLIGAIISFLLLVLTPLVLMLILQPWDSGGRGRSGDLDAPMGSAAAGTIPANASFLVGKWSGEPDCVRQMEFRADGSMVNHRGQIASWSAEGSPPMVTLNIPGSVVRGELEETMGGARIKGAGPGQEMNLYRCASSASGGADQLDNGMMGGNATAPMSGGSGSPITASSMVGYWSRTDCTVGLRLNADGSFVNTREGQSGRWSIGAADGKTTFTQTVGADSQTNYVFRIDDNIVRLQAQDGAPDTIMHRCPA